MECEKRVKEIVTREKVNNHHHSDNVKEETIIKNHSLEDSFFNFIGNTNVAIGNYKSGKQVHLSFFFLSAFSKNN